MIPARRCAGTDDDSGQVMLLILVYSLLLFLLVTSIATATSVHLQRTRLASLADAAALDAADALSPTRYFDPERKAARPSTGQVPLDDVGVQESVRVYLRSAPDARRLTGVSVGQPTGVVDATTAEVTLTAQARIPVVTVLTAGWLGRIELRVTARAQARSPGQEP